MKEIISSYVFENGMMGLLDCEKFQQYLKEHNANQNEILQITLVLNCQIVQDYISHKDNAEINVSEFVNQIKEETGLSDNIIERCLSYISEVLNQSAEPNDVIENLSLWIEHYFPNRDVLNSLIKSVIWSLSDSSNPSIFIVYSGKEKDINNVFCIVKAMLPICFRENIDYDIGVQSYKKPAKLVFLDSKNGGRYFDLLTDENNILEENKLEIRWKKYNFINYILNNYDVLNSTNYFENLQNTIDEFGKDVNPDLNIIEIAHEIVVEQSLESESDILKAFFTFLSVPFNSEKVDNVCAKLLRSIIAKKIPLNETLQKRLQEKLSVTKSEDFKRAGNAYNSPEKSNIDFSQEKTNATDKTEISKKDSSVNIMKFDSKRYIRESKENLYVLGKQAYDEENYTDALSRFQISYKLGNILSGVNLGVMYYSGLGCDKNYEKAVSVFVDCMSQGSPLGAERLAAAYRLGKGVPKDKAKAKELWDTCVSALEDMCVIGCREAQHVFGFNLLYENFEIKDEEKGFYWLNKAMENDDNSAGVYVAICYLNGWGVEKNPQKALELFEKYSKTQNKLAHFELGKLYYYGNTVEKDYKKAYELFLFAAERELSSAQMYLGDMYFWGEGIEQDYVQAREWYLKSDPDNSNTWVQRQLGFIYHYGHEVDVNYDLAFDYFKKSADGGNARAQYMLHNYYFSDTSFKNYDNGWKYLELSAEQGDELAQYELGRYFYTEKFGRYDEEKGIYWLKKAAENGYAEAEYRLGWAYEIGEHCEIDYNQAVAWLKKAIAQNYFDAKLHLAKMYLQDKVEESLNVKSSTIKQAVEEALEKKLIDEVCEIADLAYVNDSFKVYSFEVYCRLLFEFSYLLKDKKAEITYNVAKMHFIDNFSNDFVNVTTERNLMVDLEIYSRHGDFFNGKISLLLGQIYEEKAKNAYLVKTSDKKLYFDEMLKWYGSAMQKGSIDAALRLAEIKYDRGEYKESFEILNKVYETAKKAYVTVKEPDQITPDKFFLKKEYKKGAGTVVQMLAIYYKMGIGTKKDRKIAKKLFSEAVEMGYEADKLWV